VSPDRRTRASTADPSADRHPRPDRRRVRHRRRACDFLHISGDGGFGEVLVMIAIMIAFQAEIVWRRARVLGARASDRTPVSV